jgi:hypothetical protein
MVLAGAGVYFATRTPVESESGVESAPGRVTVRVSGAPEGALIFYDGRRMNENPFSVPLTETVMTVRVEAPGFEPFSATLVPNRDTSVRAFLSENTAPAVSSAGSQSIPSQSPAPSSAPTPEQGSVTSSPPNKKSGIGKSARGTFYSEEFE